MAPEYQGGGTWIERDHPDFFLTLKDEEVADLPPFKILNFGDKRALKMSTSLPKWATLAMVARCGCSR